tara:strand:+ start:617 stop:1216 length:600 start_codon:yes stop_codon:yes gene_type:complete
MSKQDYSKELTEAISKVSQEFPNENVSNMLKFVASAETDYGRYNPETAYSYGPFQIDPIRYYDIAQNPNRVNKERIEKANKFLRTELGNEDFDISKLAVYNPETQDYVQDSRNLEALRNPLVGATLTRLALMQDRNPIPGNVDEMATYYLKDFWRPAVQTEEKRQDAIRKFNMYNPNAFEDNMVDNTMMSNNILNNAFK